MKKIYVLPILLIAIALMIPDKQLHAQDPNFHIYLCFGQSNMEGQGEIKPEDSVVDSRLKVMQSVTCGDRQKGLWYTATPPLCRCYTRMGPADYFGRTMVAHLPEEITVGIINVSVGGCKIELFDKNDYNDYAEDWMKTILEKYDNNPYNYLVELTKIAQKDGVIKGILLHQGESDNGDKQWPTKVKTIYENFISDLVLNPASVPLLVGELVSVDYGGICAGHNAIIATLPEILPNSYVIPSNGCTPKGDSIHFNRAGYQELGKRYAEQMLILYNK